MGKKQEGFDLFLKIDSKKRSLQKKNGEKIVLLLENKEKAKFR